MLKTALIILSLALSANLCGQNKRVLATHKKTNSRQSIGKVLEALSTQQIKDYNQQAIRRVRAFGIYLELMADEERSQAEKDLAFEKALDLFVDQDIMIEDSTFNRNAPFQSRLTDFLETVSRQNRSGSKLEWNDINSTQGFDRVSGIKEVEFLEFFQVFRNDQTTEKKIKSEKLIETYFTVGEKYIHSTPKRLFLIKLGNIRFKAQ
jgi:hypothetical protein